MITIEINEAAITAALQDTMAALTDMSPIMNKVGAVMRDQTEDRFATGKAPDGTPWAPRSPATIAAYAARAKKPGGQKSWGGVLHYSGQLANNIFHKYGPDFAEVGSAEPYASTMQFGAAAGAFGAFIGKDKLGRDHVHSIPWGDIPARPFLGVSEDDQAEILDTISDALAAALGD